MAGAGRLDVSLGLNAAEYTRGLDKAARDAEKFQRDMVSLGKTVGTALGVGLAAAAAGVIALTKSSIDAADKLNDLSKATGVSVEQLGGIGFAAKQSGADLEGVAQSFGKLNLKIAEAARGEKEATEAFKALGISVKDAAGKTKNADVIFSEIATSFEAYADGPEKAALGNALFGKSYQTLLPLLADGGKSLQDNIKYYERFGGVTTETARAADEFNDTLGKLDLVVGQLGRNLAKELLTPLQAVTDEFLKVAESSGAFDSVAKGARVVFETIAILGANVVFVFQGIGREIAAVAAQMFALANLDFNGFRAISDAVKEDGVRARAELDALEKRIQGIGFSGLQNRTGSGLLNPDRLLDRVNNPLRPQAPSLGGGRGGGRSAAKKAKEEIDEVTKAYEQYLQQLTRGLEKESELSEVQKLTFALQQGALRQLSDDRKAALLYYAEQIDAQDEFNKKIAEQARLTNEANAAREQRQSRVDDLFGNNQRKKDLEDMVILQEELNSTGDLEAYTEAWNRRFPAAVTDNIKEANSAAEELGLTFSSALEDAIIDFSSIRDVVKGLEQDLLRIGTRKLVTEPLANWATELFKGMGSSGGGGSGDALGSIIGALGGLFGGSHAAGKDYVPRDMLAYVHRGEKIIPAHEARSSGNVNMTFVLPPGGVSRETQNQIAQRAGQAIRQSQRIS